MVRAHHFSVMGHFFYLGSEGFAYCKVIQPPPHIPRPRTSSIGPPSIVTVTFRGKFPKHIDVAMGKKLPYLRSLHRKKTDAVLISLRSRDILFGVTDIKVSGNDDLLPRC